MRRMDRETKKLPRPAAAIVTATYGARWLGWVLLGAGVLGILVALGGIRW